MNEPIFNHEKLDVYRLSVAYIAFSHRTRQNICVAEGSSEYEYRDAEYEYEAMPEFSYG